MQNVIYSSRQMGHIIKMIMTVAKTDSPVFLLGETGVGKEIVAGLIHSNSNRRNKPFAIINCAAIPNELLETELFGYEEGAFTSAKKNGHMGLLENISGGTLFLDEISEFPIRMQAKLLRFIQDGKFMRIGGKRMIEVDIRILAATNMTKKQLTNKLIFRQDLLYRLSVFPIHIPALRERKDDIITLIDYFLKVFNRKYGKDVHLSNKMINLLSNYLWPGNVRELKNYIERIIIMSETQEVDENVFEDLLGFYAKESQWGEKFDNTQSIEGGGTPPEMITDRALSLKDAIQQLEENMIKLAYKKTGSIHKAAEKLGIHPSTIHRKLNKNIIRLK